MAPEMLCSISDGPQLPEDVREFEIDEDDEAFIRLREEQIYDAAARLRMRARKREELIK